MQVKMGIINTYKSTGGINGDCSWQIRTSGHPKTHKYDSKSNLGTKVGVRQHMSYSIRNSFWLQ